MPKANSENFCQVLQQKGGLTDMDMIRISTADPRIIEKVVEAMKFVIETENQPPSQIHG